MCAVRLKHITKTNLDCANELHELLPPVPALEDGKLLPHEGAGITCYFKN